MTSATREGGKPTFDMAGIRAGAMATLPLCVGVAVYGPVYGMLARQAGMTMFEAVGMSALVYAGASQFVALDMWTSPLPVAALILTALAVNLRHVLMGASLPAWFHAMSWPKKAVSAYFLVDEGWAMTMAEYGRGSTQGSFMLGTGLVLFVTWVGATAVGMVAGGLIPDPEALGLDFAFTAVFIFLLAGLWRGRADLVPWIVAGGAATVCSVVLPGKWYIIIGGLAGALAGAWRNVDKS